MLDLYLFVLIVCGLDLSGQVTCVQGFNSGPPVTLQICSRQLRDKGGPVFIALAEQPVVSFQAYCQLLPKPGQEINLPGDQKRY